MTATVLTQQDKTKLREVLQLPILLAWPHTGIGRIMMLEEMADFADEEANAAIEKAMRH